MTDTNLLEGVVPTLTIDRVARHSLTYRYWGTEVINRPRMRSGWAL